jgi:hypothetical protein
VNTSSGRGDSSKKLPPLVPWGVVVAVAMVRGSSLGTGCAQLNYLIFTEMEGDWRITPLEYTQQGVKYSPN